jgi:hypothetical protein
VAAAEAVAPRGGSRGRALLWAIALAAAAVVALGWIERRAIEAWTAPSPAPSPTLPPESPQRAAAALRDRALDACAERLFAPCERDLDEARRIDPAGEDDVRVQKARTAIREGREQPHGPGPKPQP